MLKQAAAERAGEQPLEDRSFEAAVLNWSTQILPGRKSATQARYLTSIRQLSSHMSGLVMSAVDQPVLNRYVAARMEAGASPATVRRDLNVMSQVWRVAKRAGWVTGANPAIEELGEIKEMRDPVRPAETRHIAMVIARASRMYAHLLRFCARTGCRQDEAASLEWSELDLRQATATFIDTKTRSPRVIELTAATVRDLSRVPRAPGCDYVFWNTYGGSGPDRYREPGHSFAQIANALTAQAKRRGGRRFRRFRFHDLRHTFAIRWLQRGGDIYALSRHLGHSTVDTTDRVYGAWLRRDMRARRA